MECEHDEASRSDVRSPRLEFRERVVARVRRVDEQQIDGRAVPKVIDFGIARVTDQLATGETALTQLGQFIGTPEYMSPEQADLVTADIDTSSEKRRYRKNAYRVLLTRARQGMVLFIPKGDQLDPTTSPIEFDATEDFLIDCGVALADPAIPE